MTNCKSRDLFCEKKIKSTGIIWKNIVFKFLYSNDLYSVWHTVCTLKTNIGMAIGHLIPNSISDYLIYKLISTSLLNN